MAELHETGRGKILFDHVIPKIAKQLEKIATSLEYLVEVIDKMNKAEEIKQLERIANALELKQSINDSYFIDELFSKSLFKPILETKIEDMKLSKRTHNCLQAQGIRTIGELVQKTKTAMLRYKNFGKKCMNEIYWKLKLDYGIDKKSFKPDYHPPRIRPQLQIQSIKRAQSKQEGFENALLHDRGQELEDQKFEEIGDNHGKS